MLRAAPVISGAAAGAVKVEGGLVQGVAEGDLAVYKGIPFAAPPIGDFRWKAAQPVVAWSGVRERYGPFADRLLAAYPTAGDAVTKAARDSARDSAFGWHTWSWARLPSARGKGKACGLAEGTGPVLRLRHKLTRE